MLAYVLNLNFFVGVIDPHTLSLLKRSFHPFSLLPPPTANAVAYVKHVSLSYDNVLEDWIDQQVKRRKSKKREVFVQGRQNNLSDISLFLANNLLFLDLHGEFLLFGPSTTLPLVIRLFKNILDTITSVEARDFFACYEPQYPYLAHMLACMISNIFLAMAKLSKRAIPSLKKEGYILVGIFWDHEKLAWDLVQEIEYCYLANMLGNIFLHKPITYPLFFPDGPPKRALAGDNGLNVAKNPKLGRV